MSNIVPFGRSGGGDLRSPPSSSAAESGVLGSILMDERVYDHVADFLEARHFASELNARIFSVIVTLIERGETVNPVTVHPYLAADDLLDAAGGMKYLVGLSSGLVTRGNAAAYGKVVYDAYLRREMLSIASEAVERAYSSDTEVSATAELEAVEQRLFDLATLGAREDTLVTAGAAAGRAIAQIEAAYRRGGGIIGTPTGLRDLDGKLAGLHPSDLIILAGRPSMGKTALALTIAVNAARYFRDTDRPEDQGKQVVFFSLEMSSEQLMGRLISAITRIDHHRLRNGHLSQQDMEAVVAAQAEIDTLPLSIDDQPATSASAIRVRCRRLARRKKKAVGLGVIDYLQLMAPPVKKGEHNRVQEVSAITGGLKACAKSLRIPILALSQLSRAVEQREDKRPQLSDLRESGSIEQDSDVVMFVYRDEYYLQRLQPKERADDSAGRLAERQAKWEDLMELAANKAEVIIGKQRHGPTGTVDLYFDGRLTWFSDLETIHHDASQYAQATRPVGGLQAAAEQAALDLGGR